MSRIGKKPIQIPPGVTAHVTDFDITIKGAKGELQYRVHSDIMIVQEGETLLASPRRKTKKTPALWGLTRSLVENMVRGVTTGFQKKLEFEGVGYRASVEGDTLVMQLGFSHPVRFTAPEGIKFLVEKNTITITGIDKEKVGNTAARIRKLRPPEPYKGKGIRYQGEVIRRKAGKKAVASA